MTWRYQLTRDPQEALRQRLRELASVRVRFGYRRLTVVLRREGWRVNAKRIYRLYGLEGLEVRTKPRKRLASRARVVRPVVTDIPLSAEPSLDAGRPGCYARP
jgi:putative transposase